MESPQAELLNALSTLLATGRFSDLTVICNDQRYAVHKALLCSRSYFFDRACTAGFLESSNGVIDLSEDDEEAVEHMMHYFYHLDYLDDIVAAPRPSQTTTTAAPSWFDSKQQRPALKKLDLSAIEDPLVAIANARQPSAPSSPVVSPTQQAPRVPSPAFMDGYKRSPSPTNSSKSDSHYGHRRMRSRKYSRVSEASPRTPTMLQLPESLDMIESADDTEFASPDVVMHARVYALAEKFGIPGLKALAKKKFELLVQSCWSDQDLSEAMEEVYESTIEDDRGLRDVIVQAFRSHPELAYRPDVVEVLHAVEPLAWDLHRVQSGIPISV